MQIHVLLAIAMIGLSTSAAVAKCDSACQNACPGYADFETAHQILHLEGISHAEAAELINKSSEEVRAYAGRALKRCVAAGGNLPIHHYCHEDEVGEKYKCKKHNPWQY